MGRGKNLEGKGKLRNVAEVMGLKHDSQGGGVEMDNRVLINPILHFLFCGLLSPQLGIMVSVHVGVGVGVGQAPAGVGGG